MCVFSNQFNSNTAIVMEHYHSKKFTGIPLGDKEAQACASSPILIPQESCISLSHTHTYINTRPVIRIQKCSQSIVDGIDPIFEAELGRARQ